MDNNTQIHYLDPEVYNKLPDDWKKVISDMVNEALKHEEETISKVDITIYKQFPPQKMDIKFNIGEYNKEN